MVYFKADGFIYYLYNEPDYSLGFGDSNNDDNKVSSNMKVPLSLPPITVDDVKSRILEKCN